MRVLRHRLNYSLHLFVTSKSLTRSLDEVVFQRRSVNMSLGIRVCVAQLLWSLQLHYGLVNLDCPGPLTLQWFGQNRQCVILGRRLYRCRDWNVHWLTIHGLHTPGPAGRNGAVEHFVQQSIQIKIVTHTTSQWQILLQNHAFFWIFDLLGREMENPEDNWDPRTERVLKRICQDIAFEVLSLWSGESVGSPTVLHGWIVLPHRVESFYEEGALSDSVCFVWPLHRVWWWQPSYCSVHLLQWNRSVVLFILSRSSLRAMWNTCSTVCPTIHLRNLLFCKCAFDWWNHHLSIHSPYSS